MQITASYHNTTRKMKKSFNVFVVATFALLVSCSSPENSDTPSSSGEIQRTVSEVVITSGTPVTIASLGIEGMSCEKMCGGAIKKALESTEGVISAKIDFDAENDIDVAIVEYRSTEIGDKELITVVNDLRNGIYKVRSVNVETQVKEKGAKSEEDEDRTAMIPSRVRLPSLMDLLSAVLN